MRYVLGVFCVLVVACNGNDGARARPRQVAKRPVPERKAEVRFPTGIGAEVQVKLERMLDAARAACPPLGGDIWRSGPSVAIETEANPKPMCGLDLETATICAPRFERYGWRFLAGIHVETADETLHFWLGTGRKSGLVVNKRSERIVCGLPDDSSDDTFISLPDLDEVIAGESSPDVLLPLRRK